MVHAEPLAPEHAEALGPIDAAAAERVGREPMLSDGAMGFYARAGHAFVAVRDGEPCGFALAQAVWDGRRATLRLKPLAVADAADDEARAALLEAVTKSAYDAAVYDLVAEAAEADARAQSILEREGWRPEPVRTFRRTLGSRGATAGEAPGRAG